MKQTVPLGSAIVTGGAGFIGSHLVDMLISERCHVTVVDDLSSPAVSLLEIEEWKRRGANIVIEDVCQFSPVSTSACDVIFHLASVVGPVGVLAHAGDIGHLILSGTYKVIDLAKRVAAKLIFVSSSEIYGVPGVLTESTRCSFDPTDISARAEYAQSKRLSEIVVCNNALSGLHYQIIRPFNVAGPRQLPSGGFVLPRFVLQALGKLPLTVYGSGRQIRAFTHVSDIIDGLIRCVGYPRSEVWNLGAQENAMTISQIAKAVVDRLGGTISHVDPRDLHGPEFADANDKIPSAQKASVHLGWEPNRDVNTILDDVIKYWQNNSNLLKWTELLVNEPKSRLTKISST
jgi:UDP-glucose 4-epimerase